MPAEYFIDTNLLVYAYSEDEQDKRRTVLELVERHACLIQYPGFERTGECFAQAFWFGVWRNPRDIGRGADGL